MYSGVLRVVRTPPRLHGFKATVHTFTGAYTTVGTHFGKNDYRTYNINENIPEWITSIGSDRHGHDGDG